MRTRPQPQLLDKQLPTVVIVGKVNVGKSTLFNRLLGKRGAITSPTPGTTRTYNEGVAMWRGVSYRLVDTGGRTFTKGAPFEKEISAQVATLVARANVVLFVCDVREDLSSVDRAFARILRTLRAPVILVANKADTPVLDGARLTKEWFALGFGESLPVSAASGRGIGELLDTAWSSMQQVHTFVAKDEVAEAADSATTVAIVGKPNVGKSTLFNTLIGEDRAIVSPIPHTTRESFDTEVRVGQTRYIFVDTAGMRRRAHAAADVLEKMGIAQTVRTIERADVVLLVLDAQDPTSHQDRALAGLVEDKKKGVIVVVNKWDIAVEKSNMENEVSKSVAEAELEREWKKNIAAWYRFVEFAPIIFTSALTGMHVASLYKLISRVAEARATRIAPEVLERVRQEIVRKRQPLRGKGVRHPRIVALKQVDSHPPTFEVSIKVKTSLHHAYLKFLEHELRSRYTFLGTPLVIYMKKVRVI